jgi:hypothetical protein
MTGQKLKAPWPAFGGKSKVAPVIWSRLGQVSNYIEPMCHSAAVLLGRPDAPRIETVNEANGGMTNAWRATDPRHGDPAGVAAVCEWINDVDEYVCNAWRAIQGEPEQLAEECNLPVNELNMHAAHRWLVLGKLTAEFRERVRRDPAYFDVRRAGLWISGICAWIGGGWCSGGTVERFGGSTPALAGSSGGGQGVHCQERRKPNLGGLEDQHGRGVHAKGLTRKKVRLTGRSEAEAAGTGIHARESVPDLSGDYGASGRGVHASGQPRRMPRLAGLRRGEEMFGGQLVHQDQTPSLADSQRRPGIDEGAGYGNGVNSAARVQLGDAYCRGRGVNGNDSAGTCEDRQLWLLDWFSRLRDRLRTVRVCCGDWLRVCDSDSVTTRLGVTGLFLDPPYPRHKRNGSHSRNGSIYASDFGGKSPEKLRDEILKYCLERGRSRRMRIVVAGYEGDGYERLVKKGWEEVAWKAAGGYGNRSEVGKANAKRERLWCSPHCVREVDLFGGD